MKPQAQAQEPSSGLNSNPRRLALPHWARKKSSFGFRKSASSEEFEIHMKSEEIGSPEVPNPKELIEAALSSHSKKRK